MNRFGNIITILLIAAYCCLRYWRLTDACIWFDEIYSIDAASHGWNAVAGYAAADLVHPPLFYFVLKGWIAAGGDGILWLRMLPFVLAVFAVVPFISICRELSISAAARNTALLLIAVNGPLIKYAQEVRMYTMLQLMSLMSIWLFLRWTRREGSILPLAAVDLILVYTHYFGWLVIAAETVVVLWQHRAKARIYILHLAVVAAAFVPWAAAVIMAARKGSDVGQNIGWMQRPGPLELIQFALDLIEPIYTQATNLDAVTNFSVTIPLLFVIAAAVGTGIIFYLNNKERTLPQEGLMVAAAAVLPTIIAFVVSWCVPYSVWGTRHLIIVFMPVALLLGIAVDQIGKVWIRNSIFVAILLLSGCGLYAEYRSPKANNIWCAWPSSVEAAANNGADKIYTFEDLVAYHAWFAVRERTIPQIIKLNGEDGIAEDKAYFLPRGFDGVTTVNVSRIDGSPLWLMYRAKGVDVTTAPLARFAARGYTVTWSNVIPTDDGAAVAVRMQRAEQ